MFAPLTLLVILSTLGYSSSENVLMLTPFNGRSHKILFTALAKGLAKNGHNITLFSVFEPSEKQKNITELVTPETELHLQLRNCHVRTGKEGINFGLLKDLGRISGQLCDNFYSSDQFNQLKTVEFDSIIVDGVMSECTIPVAHLLTKTVIVLNTAALFPWLSYPMNVPTPYSFVPALFIPIPPKMTFVQRFENAISYELFRILDHWLVEPILEGAIKKHFPAAKSIYESIADVSLVLVNADSVISVARPEMPRIKHVGGLHLSFVNKQLPKDLLEFVDSSGDSGVVLFSLGSIFDEMLTPNVLSVFINAFSKLKYKILWKYGHELENLPTNVKVVKWLPQQDLLANPKIRVFITHGGLLSLQEAFYHQVPTVILPVFADQPHNSAHLAQKNAAVSLQWNDLTVDNVIAAITRAAEDETIRTNVKRMSKMFRKTPISSIKKAVFWVEYAMRHSGAAHLQSIPTKQLNIFQYFSIDVILFLLSIILLIFSLIYMIISRCISRLNRKNK